MRKPPYAYTPRQKTPSEATVTEPASASTALRCVVISGVTLKTATFDADGAAKSFPTINLTLTPALRQDDGRSPDFTEMSRLLVDLLHQIHGEDSPVLELRVVSGKRVQP